jgi:hypothetical protein
MFVGVQQEKIQWIRPNESHLKSERGPKRTLFSSRFTVESWLEPRKLKNG